MTQQITKFLVLFFLAGVLGGAMFGFMLALLVLGIYYFPVLFLVFLVLVTPFYIPGIWKILTKHKTYLVIIRKGFEIFLISGFLTAMFCLEEGLISFNNFDRLIIYICLGIAIILLTFYLFLEEYFNQSRIYQELDHIIKGMQFYGVLPKETKKK